MTPNILLVRKGDENEYQMLEEVTAQLRNFGARTRMVWDVEPRFKHFLWSLASPTFVVSFRPIQRFFPSWATIFQQERHNKIREYEVLKEAGISVPKWKVIQQNDESDLSGFPEFVVVKPANGSCGALVQIMRRDRVRWRALEVKNKRSETDAIIVQEYVHTGPWPTSFRVATVFGEPIHTWRLTADRSRKPFEGETINSDFFVGRSIVSSAKGCTYDKEVPEDVLKLARQVHETAFQNIPLLSIDIIQDCKTGELYVLELNLCALNIVPTRVGGRQLREEFGFDPWTQFGGAKAIARGIYGRLAKELKN